MRAAHKEFFLLIPVVIFSFLLWLSFSVLLPDLSWQLTPALWSSFISVLLLMVFWGLSVMLVESAVSLAIAWAISSYAGVLWFPNPTFIAGASILFIGGIIGYWRTRSQIRETLEGGIVRPLRKSLPLTSTVVILAISTAAFLEAPGTVQELTNLVPKTYFENVLGYMEPVIRSFDSHFGKDKTLIAYMTDKSGIDTSELTQVERSEIADSARAEIRERYGIDIDPNMTLSDVLYEAGTEMLQRRLNTYELVVPLTFAAALFFALRFLAFFVNWIVILIVAVALRTMLRFGIVELRAIPTTITAYSFP